MEKGKDSEVTDIKVRNRGTQVEKRVVGECHKCHKSTKKQRKEKFKALSDVVLGLGIHFV